jgi:putative sterol carrier protein
MLARGIRYLRLLPIAQRLVEKASQDEELRELAKRINRSAQLIAYDEFGVALELWIGVEEGRPVVKQGRYPSTNTLRAHIDALIDILKGRVDFREAVLHGVVEMESHDGLPWFYHFALWSAFFEKVRQLLS